MALLPVGTKIYSFLSCPYRIIEGSIIQILPKEKGTIFRYLVELFDPVSRYKFYEHFYWVYLTEEEAKKSYEQIQQCFERSKKS